MKLDRLLNIIMLLNGGSKITANELALKFEVSQRTIQRDIDTLCMAGIPIIAHPGYQGGYMIDKKNILDKTFFSDIELAELSSFLKGWQALMNNDSAKTTFKKLNNMLKPDFDDGGRKTSKNDGSPYLIDFTSMYGSRLSGKVSAIKEAIQNKKVVSFNYISAMAQKTKREIEPIILSYRFGTWYIDAYCLLRKDFRQFKVMRMDDIVITDMNFEMRKMPYYEPDNNSEHHVPTKVQVKFRPEYSSLSVDHFDLSNVDPDDDGWYFTEINGNDDKMFYDFILGFGTAIEVIGPQNIRQGIRNRADEVLSTYNNI